MTLELGKNRYFMKRIIGRIETISINLEFNIPPALKDSPITITYINTFYMRNAIENTTYETEYLSTVLIFHDVQQRVVFFNCLFVSATAVTTRCN